MVPLHLLLPELAEEAKRQISTRARPGLPADDYVFVEGHCADPSCDCRRVRFIAFSERRKEILAAIDYSLPAPKPGRAKAAAKLAPGVPSSPLAAKLLALLEEALKEPEYAARVEDHYQKVRAALADPRHPLYERLKRQAAWLGTRFLLPTYILEPEPYRPELALWVDGKRGRILAQEILPPGAPADALAALLERTLAAKKLPPPAYLRVSEEAQAEALRRTFGGTSTVEVGPLPELEMIKEDLSQHLGGGEPEPSYLQGGRIAPESMARLFRAAARLYKAAPWKVMSDSESPALEIPSLGVSGAAYSVMGRGGQSFGFMLFSSGKDALSFRDFAERHEGGPTEEKPGVSFLTLDLVPGAELSPKRRKEIASHRWEVAGPKAYPELRALDPDLVLKPHGEEEVALLTAAAEALAAFAERHKKALAAGEPFTTQEELESQELPGKPHLKLRWPHPELSPPTDDSGEQDPDGLPSAARETLEAFLGSQESRGEGWRWLAEGVVSELYRFLVHYERAPLDGFRAAVLERFLLSHFPRKVSIPEEDTARVPDVLLAFFSWLEAERRLPAATAKALREKIEALREESFAAANDPGLFGPAKAMFALAQRHGIDLSDPKAFQRFVERCNAGEVEGFQELMGEALSQMGLPPTPTKGPSKRPKAVKRSKPSKKR
jgi:hypothetical protein